MLPLYKHQEDTANFIFDNEASFILNDPGTGKTRSLLHAFNRHKMEVNPQAVLLVIGPLSILQPAWAGDIEKFYPHLTYSLCYAKTRKRAFGKDVDIYLLNHQGVDYPVKHIMFGKSDWICIDESTAYKNISAKRTKHARTLCKSFGKRVLMTGTPTPNSVADIWTQMHCLDGGKRLGTSFVRFRDIHQHSRPIFGHRPNIRIYVDKPDAINRVNEAIADITKRYTLEECLDLPDNRITTYNCKLPPRLLSKYREMQETSVIELASKAQVTAVHAGALVKKLLQVCTGAVYDSSGEAQYFDTARYELVIDLAAERLAKGKVLVAFNWRHEREALSRLANDQGIYSSFIDGTVSATDRNRIVDDFQNGQTKVLFCNPSAAAHGLTLTQAVTTIWCSPTYSSEHFQQFNRRSYRAGQTKKTETILIAADKTAEEQVYEKLNNKLTKMTTLLGLFENKEMASA